MREWGRGGRDRETEVRESERDQCVREKGREGGRWREGERERDQEWG